MIQESPYEYHNNKLGVQGRYIFSGPNSSSDSLCLIGERGLQQRISRGGCLRLRENAPNTPMLVLFDSLPYGWQNALVHAFGNPPKQEELRGFRLHYRRDYEAFDFYSAYRFEDMSTLEITKIDEYTLDASVLKAVEIVYTERVALQRSLRRGVKRADIWDSVCAECTAFKSIQPHKLPENVRRFREKYNLFKKEGFESLIHKGRGNRNALVIDEKHGELLNNLYAGIDYKPNYTELHQIYEGFLDGYVEVINNETGEVYNPKEYKRVSAATIRNWLAKWENKIGNELARSGDRQLFMQKFKPYGKIKPPVQAGSLLSIDDRQPPFEYDTGKRLWFYNAIDLGSEAFTCWVYGKSKEGIILDFYRQLVRNYAEWNLPLPDGLECESSLNSSFKNTFLKEGNMFQDVRIEANNARGKRIERYYGTLRYKYEKKREGWLARPFALAEANQKRSDKKVIVPYSEIVEGCLRDIWLWNNAPHSKIKNMSRWDVFLAMQNPATRPTNYHGILPYLGYETKTSVRAGIINFRSTQFLLGMNGKISTGDELIKLMQLVEGSDVTIKWLDATDGSILKAFVYLGEQFICEAMTFPTYSRAVIERTPEDLVNREIVSKYVNTVDAFSRRRKNSLDKITVIDNIPVTIGNSFKMPGLAARYEANEDEAKTLPSIEINQNLNIPQTESFNRALGERF